VKLIELTPKCQFVVIPDKGKKRLLDLVNKDRKCVDVMFIAAHGTPGEDGTVQGMLQLLGIRYTGPNTLASAIAMNKVRTADIYRSAGIATPEFVHFTKKEWQKNKAVLSAKIETTIGFPAVIKPVDQGSAVGVEIPKNKQELEAGIARVLKKFSWLMVQQYIRGQEATCGVIEKRGVPFALPPTHILPNYGEFYDYVSKYKTGGSTHVCPADFDDAVNAKIQDVAIKAHQALWCTGMSRTDIFVDEESKVWAIETNTIPGMTPTSLLPEAAAKGGISFPEMLDLIILASL
jgi:D-alanine-D-alanine ligase